MRIIGGKHRGRRLAAPEGLATRPMLDRVREALFSSLHARFADAAVLDLFAGTGAMSLEALSRGARFARAVEWAKDALAALRANAETLGVGERLEVRRGDALMRGAWMPGDAGPWAVVFFDPPYPMLRDLANRRRMLGAIESLVLEHCTPEGVLVFHAPVHAVSTWEFGTRIAVRERSYGTSTLWYARRPGASGNAEDEVAADRDAQPAEDGS